MAGHRAVEPKRAHYQLTFAVLTLSALAFSVMQSLIIPALPSLEHSLHASADAVAWLLTGYLLSAAICTPILGRVGDMMGKERVLAAILVVLTLGTLISALATTLPIMLAGRIITGAGGAVFPLAFGIIRDEFPRERVVGGIGFLSSILGVGVGLGIVLSGPIIVHLNYHWLFWAPLILCVIATVMTILFVPESPIRTPGRINTAGALLMSGWLVAGLLAVSEGPDIGWGDPWVIGLFLLAIVLMALWIRSENRSDVAAGGHEDDAYSRGVDDQPLRPAVRVRDVRDVHDRAAVRRDADQQPLRTRRLGHPIRTRSASLRRRHAPGRPAHRPPVRRLRCPPGTAVRLHLLRIVLRLSRVLARPQLADPYRSRLARASGSPWATPPCPTWWSRRCRQSQTGIATGMNTNIRNVGGAVGAGVATSMVVSSLLPNGTPAEHGYILAFVVSALALLVAAGTALLIPRHPVHEPSGPELASAISGGPAAVVGSASGVE